MITCWSAMLNSSQRLLGMNFRFSSTTMRIIWCNADRLAKLGGRMPFLPKGICDCVEVWKESV